ncbi:MAG: hypothetical protein IPP82_07965 [Xanthomonadales bacterium]|nr:hypothetical protein [Xanthomonadales bacterium]
MFNSIRFSAGAALILAAFAAPVAAADLLIHDGFEACWVTAKTKPQFLESIRTSIDGTTACIAPRSGSQSGVGYTICQTTNGCGGGVDGCGVTMQAGIFSGSFVTGAFAGPGSATNIAIPVTTTVLGNCTINLTGVSLAYSLDYLMQNDGTDGVYSVDLMPPGVSITNYATSNNCNPLLAGVIASYVPQAIAAAETNAALAIEPDLRTDTLGQSVCPLSAP